MGGSSVRQDQQILTQISGKIHQNLTQNLFLERASCIVGATEWRLEWPIYRYRETQQWLDCVHCL